MGYGQQGSCMEARETADMRRLIFIGIIAAGALVGLIVCSS
jgi:hypothetical protein